MTPSLPSHLASIDFKDLESLTPEDLMLRPRLVYRHLGQIAGARALVYARAAGDSYDEIGYRSLSATPQAGPVPLQTIPRMLKERETADRTIPAPRTR